MPRTAAILLSCLLLAAAPARAEGLDVAGARHLLDRAGYGPAPGELAALRRQGAAAWLRAQLHPGAEPPALAARLAKLVTLREPPQPLKQARAKGDATALEDAQAGRLWRAAGSPWQLREAMVELWADHFNVFQGKGPVRAWIGSYEETAIRPHALGRFRDLLGAVAAHPAMLFYLDNWRNGAKGLNENYARELMELHTLGVDGGYTQADVQSLAKILTGWSFTYLPKRHVGGPKTLLGVIIPAGGRAEVEAALDLLARHPATAKHVARKLAERFVADVPPQALVDRLAARYLATDGRIDAVLEALFSSTEFAAARQAKFKSPYRLVVSMARATGDPLADGTAALRAMKQLGQPLFGCPTPDGWPTRQAAWLGPDAMATRTGLAVPFSKGAEGLEATLGEVFGASTRAALDAAPPRLRPALILGSPEFQRY